MTKTYSLSDAVAGAVLSFEARQLSDNTIQSYRNAYNKLLAFLPADPPLDSITPQQVEAFLSAQTGVTRATLNKYHTALSSLWTWALKERIVSEHILRRVARPKPEDRDIVPISEADVRALLSAVGRSRSYKRPGQRSAVHSLPDSERNRAILLTLLDTGIRATELCRLEIRHAELRNRDKYLTVHNGKGRKDRHLPISAAVAQAIYAYLRTRPDARLNDPLFATKTNRFLNKDNLGNMIESAARRAGIAGGEPITPHRFRHTFAINYLRNGGDIYTLQAILGHESLTMCLRYLRIAQADLENAHRRASPVDNWHL